VCVCVCVCVEREREREFSHRMCQNSGCLWVKIPIGCHHMFDFQLLHRCKDFNVPSTVWC
jgi:hypothetical protein